MIWNIGQMNYGSILGLLAIVCSLCNITIHSLHYDKKKGALHATAGENRKSPNKTLPEGKNLLQKILRNRIPRYDVSVIYLKRGSLLGNEEHHLGGDLPIFEIIYSNLEQRSIFS